jgi:hypothetical protein
MTIGTSEEASNPANESADTVRPAPDSGRRPRPREQLATLPGEQDFEHHDTIPAPPWLDEPLENSLNVP